MSNALGGLPDGMRQIAPELWEMSWPPEVLATCADCAMAPRPHLPPSDFRVEFTASARCCTYQPELPNFLVGRVLRRGGVGAGQVRARLADPDGRSVFGIRPPAAWRERYRDRKKTGPGFGRDPSLTCPYWVEGPLNCSIHLDREAVCRTWFCRSTSGERGGAAWRALRDALSAVEDAIAVHLAKEEPRPLDDAPVEAWEAWYVACAERLDALPPDVLASLRIPKVVTRSATAATTVAAREQSLPDVVMPCVQQWFPEGEHWWLTSWSAYDLVQMPKWIFALLSRLDGRIPWRAAVRATEVAIGEPIGDDLILTLWQRGLLAEPAELDAKPGWKIRLTNLPTPTPGERWSTEIEGTREP